MQNKTTYLSELDAARAENAQLSMWLSESQNAILKLTYSNNIFTKFIERQSGAVKIGATLFMKQDGTKFSINDMGKVVMLK